MAEPAVSSESVTYKKQLSKDMLLLAPWLIVMKPGKVLRCMFLLAILGLTLPKPGKVQKLVMPAYNPSNIFARARLV